MLHRGGALRLVSHRADFRPHVRYACPQVGSVTPGRGGGYALSRPAADTRVSEIITASIGEINVVDCVNYPERCDRVATCPSRAMWMRLNNVIIRTLESVSLAQLCERSLVVDDCAAYALPPACAGNGKLRTGR